MMMIPKFLFQLDYKMLENPEFTKEARKTSDRFFELHKQSKNQMLSRC